MRGYSPSTQNQALSAILFMYRNVLDVPVEWVEGIVPARRRKRLPVVLTQGEVTRLFQEMHGTPRLIAGLLYGSGLRVGEALRLRVKDIDTQRREITVREGKGHKDRRTILPESLRVPVMRHLHAMKARHERELEAGRGWVELPHAFDRKSPGAGREWAWQWVFPATRPYFHKESRRYRRHHLHRTVIQRSIKEAALAGEIPKHVTCHSLRHHADFPIMRIGWMRGGTLRGFKHMLSA